MKSHPGTGVKLIPSEYDNTSFIGNVGDYSGLVSIYAVQDIDSKTYLIYETVHKTRQWAVEYENGQWKGNVNEFRWDSPPNSADVLTAMTVGPLVAIPGAAYAGFAAAASSVWATNIAVKLTSFFWRWAPQIGAAGRTAAEFLDETGTLGLSTARPKLISTVYKEGEGLLGAYFKFDNNETLEFLAEKVVQNNQLHLKDAVGYIAGKADNEGVNSIKTGIYDVLTELKKYAKSQGFEELKITFQRAENSSSATPGHTLEKTIKL